MTSIAELQRQIEDWFAQETRLEMNISAPENQSDATAIVSWARAKGYLAQCAGGRLLVKKPSRFHSSPVVVRYRGADKRRSA